MNTKQHIPEPAKKIKIAQSELEDPENVATFISLHGRKKYLDVLEQFATARHGSGKLDEIENYLDTHDVSDEEYEELRKEIQAEQNNMVDPKEEAYAEVKLDGYETEEQFRERFMNLYGKDRYLKAMGLQGLESANKQALLNIHPKMEGYEDKQRRKAQEKEQARKAEQERKEAAKQKIMSNGSD
jgi:hypothetical protein